MRCLPSKALIYIPDCQGAFCRAVLEEHRTPGFLLVAGYGVETASLVDLHTLKTPNLFTCLSGMRMRFGGPSIATNYEDVTLQGLSLSD